MTYDRLTYILSALALLLSLLIFHAQACHASTLTPRPECQLVPVPHASSCFCYICVWVEPRPWRKSEPREDRKPIGMQCGCAGSQVPAIEQKDGEKR